MTIYPSVFGSTSVFGDSLPGPDAASSTPGPLDHPTNESPLSAEAATQASPIAADSLPAIDDILTPEQTPSSQPEHATPADSSIAPEATALNGKSAAEEFSALTTNAARPEGVFTTPDSLASAGSVSIPAPNEADPTESLFEGTHREPPMMGSTQIAPAAEYAAYDPRNARLELDDPDGSGRGWVIGLMATVAAGLIVVAGLFSFTDFFGGDGPETAATDDNLTSPLTPSEGSGESTEDLGGGQDGSTASSTDASALNANGLDEGTDLTVSTEDPPASPDTAVDGSAPDNDTGSGDDEPTSTSVLTADSAQLVDDFRLRLTNNGLTTGSLLPYELTNFGNSLCNFARDSSTTAEFSDVRARSIDNANSDLATDELNLVIDAAIVTFCPAEADRLGISAENLQIDEPNDEDGDN